MKKKTYTIKIDGHELELSNLDKVFWPAGKKFGGPGGARLTKGDVIEYYNKVAPWILPYLKDRPESMLRSPGGVKGKAFYQKDIGAKGAKGSIGPDWLQRVKVRSEGERRDLHYLICNDKATLLFMANLGCIEINPWLSRTGKLDRPNFMVMDLDPSDKTDFKTVIRVARGLKEIFDELGVPSFPKTSGATGMHIYVPMGAKYSFDQVKEFGHLIAALAHQRMPKITTLERLTRKRPRGTVLLDYLQNRKGQTLATVYSLRPKPGAPVSTPLNWSEVKAGLDPRDFNIRNIFERLERVGDLWAPVMGKGVDLRRVVRRLEN